MTTKVLAAIGIGILAGAAIFFFPFPFRFFIVFFLIFFALRFFWWSRWRYGRFHGYGYGIWHNPAYAQRWHNMSDEERKVFMQKMEKELFAGSDPATEKNK